jgi:Domain of unknown function (DUF4440)
LEFVNKDQEAVWAALVTSWDALRAKDVDAFIAGFHPDFLGWSMTREAPMDLAAERAGTETFSASYDWISHAIDPVDIRVIDDIAIVHFTYYESVREIASGSVFEDKGRATQVFKRVDGNWHTITMMVGSVLA